MRGSDTDLLMQAIWVRFQGKILKNLNNFKEFELISESRNVLICLEELLYQKAFRRSKASMPIILHSEYLSKNSSLICVGLFE